MSSKTATAEPQLLPSPPPSPSPSSTPAEHDVAVSGHINEVCLTPYLSTTNKGKGRMVDAPVEFRQSDQDIDSDEYPPDETETKRIEETLRKWDIEERERRRIARESSSSFRYSVRDVTRTASSIWAGLRSQRPRSGGGAGHHHVLPGNEHEDGLPLEDLDRTPPPSGANTPTLKRRFDTSPSHSSSTMIDNPFENPSNVLNASTTSLNTPDHPTILSESSRPPPTLSGSSTVGQKRKKGPPPPQPLGLPKPRTPPPRNDQELAYINEPPEPPAAPSTAARGEGHHNSDESEKESKWWTEWLCGCSEGPERGGYHQSGRTNPNE